MTTRRGASMILSVMRVPPDPNGRGGSQRAWFLFEALRRLAPLHFVLVSRKLDLDAASTSLEPLRALAQSVTHIDIPEWQPKDSHSLPPFARKVHTGWFDALGMRSQEAPRLSAGALDAIADQLPVREADVVFAGRIPSAIVVDQLMTTGRLRAGRRVVDFDDVMSKFRRRQLEREVRGVQSRLLARLDARRIEAAEAKVAQSWDAVSVCTEEDVAFLRHRHAGADIFRVPNVIARSRLPDRRPDGSARVLFVGNLSFPPNVQGLMLFLAEAWPEVLRRLPATRLVVAGMDPLPELVAACAAASGVELHANVPSLEPLYAECDLTIAPLLFGGGTRIKILEAMAYGRPVVSTTVGAEGLEVTPGEQALIADDMGAFADAVATLAADPALRLRIADAAKALQERRFGFEAMASPIAEMVAGPRG